CRSLRLPVGKHAKERNSVMLYAWPWLRQAEESWKQFSIEYSWLVQTLMFALFVFMGLGMILCIVAGCVKAAEYIVPRWRRWREAYALLNALNRFDNQTPPNGIGAMACHGILAAFDTAVRQAA